MKKSILTLVVVMVFALFLAWCNKKVKVDIDDANNTVSGAVVDADRDRIGDLDDKEEILIPTSEQQTGSVDPANPTITADVVYTLEEVAMHKDPASCWTAINGIVYDVTAWISKHPGGDQNILRLCGIDGTQAFDQKHGSDMKVAEVLKGFEIGKVR